MKKGLLIFIGIIVVISIPIVMLIISNNKLKHEKYENNYFSFSYDTTWKIKTSDDKVELTHKKTNSKITIKNKVLENNLIDIDLNDKISNISKLIEEQNPDYKLISVEEDPSDKYDSYSFLYENNDEQVLVNVYKKDTNLVILYYNAKSKYYDIVLDSVDSIINSLELKNIIE